MGTQLTGSQDDRRADVAADVDSGVGVLVIDGSERRRQLMAHIVEQDRGVTVVGFADGPVSALDSVSRLRVDVVVLEIQLPVAQGLDTISALRDDFPGLAIIVCSYHGAATTRRSASDRGADGYLVKPFSPPDLHATIRSAVRSRSTRGRS